MVGLIENLVDPRSTIPTTEEFIDTAVPAILPSSGTVAANGQITLSTALPATYSVGCWLYLPATALASGISGMYYAVFSSTTVGTVYTNYGDPAVGFIPTIPSGILTPAVGTGVAYTQTTAADISVMSKLLPGNYLGANGTLRGEYSFLLPNTANTKTCKTKLAGTDIRSIALTSSPSYRDNYVFKCTGSINNQFMTPGTNSTTPFGITTSIIPSQYAIDLTTSQWLIMVLRLANAVDYAILNYVTIDIKRKG